VTSHIRNTVQELRAERGITQEELAHALDVSRQTIIAIERGNYAPSVILALRVGVFFKKPVEQIFTLHD
jgi:putative transcriptional regulator